MKPGATVIDVGMNKVTDAAVFQRLFGGRLYKNAKREETFRTKGFTLAGDVHPEVAEVAGALTPVPGGVGPLTIAMLMYNTVKAAKLRRGSAGTNRQMKGFPPQRHPSAALRASSTQRNLLLLCLFSVSPCLCGERLSLGGTLLKVGLTGGIASGKSAVGEMFVALGAHLVQADRIAHELMLPGQPVYNEVVRHFGGGILNPDLSVNRAKLAEAAFGSAPDPPHLESPPASKS